MGGGRNRSGGRGRGRGRGRGGRGGGGRGGGRGGRHSRRSDDNDDGQFRSSNGDGDGDDGNEDNDNARGDNTNSNSNNYVTTITEQGNYRMEAYYAAQGLYDDCFDVNEEGVASLRKCTTFEEREAERLRWRASVASVLPASFRIGTDVPELLRNKLEAELRLMVDQAATASAADSKEEEEQQDDNNNINKDEGMNGGDNKEVDSTSMIDSSSSSSPCDAVELVRELPFLKHAYQLSQLDRAAIRRKPQYAQLHQWLKQQSSSGNITRQEAVSMIPPIVLSPQSDHLVLDMCAAPGSKTSQLLEMMGPMGCVVANDASISRAHMLTTQLRRVLPINPVAIITSCNAQFFPSLHNLQFDSILADVPCSGDGTLRKNIDVWRSWSHMGALALHVLQLDIAWKGASQLLKPTGGHICYSTCSLNPVEDEAVVAELLRRSQGQLELVDVRHLLGTFKTRPAMSTWKVFCDDKSRRQVRNQQNKNNDKMQQRRHDYEEKSLQQQKEEQAAEEDEDHAAQEDEELDGDAVADPTELDEAGEEQEAARIDEDPVKDATEDDAIGDANDDHDNGIKTNSPPGPAAERPRFAPTSYDQDELVRLVESAGLKLYKALEEVPEHLQKRLRSSVFPPTADEAATFHLERCIRCLPHDNDTGGFFVALLRKKGPISPADHKNSSSNNSNTSHNKSDSKPAVAKDDAAAAAAAAANVERDTKRIKLDDPDATGAGTGRGDGVDAAETAAAAEIRDADDGAVTKPDASITAPHVPPKRSRDKKNLVRDADGNAIPDLGRDDFVPVDDDVLRPLVEFYGLQPSLNRELLMIRAGGESKVISYIAPSVKKLFDAGLQRRVTIVTSGLKVLIRKGQDSSVSYRLSHEGLPFLAPHMDHTRKFIVNRSDFEALLSGDVVPFSSLTGDLQVRLAPVPAGSVAIVLEGYEGGGSENGSTPMMLAKWRCRADKVDNLVPKVDLEAMLDKLRALDGCCGVAAASAAPA